MDLFYQLKIHVNYLSKVLNSKLKIDGNLNTYLRFPWWYLIHTSHDGWQVTQLMWHVTYHMTWNVTGGLTQLDQYLNINLNYQNWFTPELSVLVLSTCKNEIGTQVDYFDVFIESVFRVKCSTRTGIHCIHTCITCSHRTESCVFYLETSIINNLYNLSKKVFQKVCVYDGSIVKKDSQTRCEYSLNSLLNHFS